MTSILLLAGGALVCIVALVVYIYVIFRHRHNEEIATVFGGILGWIIVPCLIGAAIWCFQQAVQRADAMEARTKQG